MTAKEAYELAKKEGLSGKTRKTACEDSWHAYLYARDIDKCARDDTRKSACVHPRFAYEYADRVDKCSREDTREAACKRPIYMLIVMQSLLTCVLE